MRRWRSMGFRDRPPALCAMAACLALAACAAAADRQSCEIAHVTDLKLARRGHAFYTIMTINGRGADVLFDTGSAESLISETTARRLGLHVDDSGMNYIVGVGGSRNTGTARSREVRLGDAHGEMLSVATIADAAVPAGGDGVLGMNFLYGFDMDLDFWGNRIRLYKALSGCGAPRAVLAEPLYSVDLVSMAYELSPTVMVSINGAHLRAVIDTGAGHSLIFRDSARRAGFSADAPLRTAELSGFGPRRVQGEIRVSAPVVIGDLTVTNMPLVVADQRHPGGVDMLLGYDFVTRVHVWVSHSSGTVIMQFPPHASPPVEGNN
jgi:predicted aspartyl protease